MRLHWNSDRGGASLSSKYCPRRLLLFRQPPRSTVVKPNKEAAYSVALYRTLQSISVSQNTCIRRTDLTVSWILPRAWGRLKRRVVPAGWAKYGKCWSALWGSMGGCGSFHVKRHMLPLPHSNRDQPTPCPSPNANQKAARPAFGTPTNEDKHLADGRHCRVNGVRRPASEHLHFQLPYRSCGSLSASSRALRLVLILLFSAPRTA